MPTRKPEAVVDSDGQLVIRVRPPLAFTADQVALALAVTYGEPRPRHGPTNITTALHRLTTLALDGEDVTAPESTQAAWRERLVEWEVFPTHD